MRAEDLWREAGYKIPRHTKTWQVFRLHELPHPKFSNPTSFMASIYETLQISLSGRFQGCERGTYFEYGFKTMLIGREMFPFATQVDFGIPAVKLDFAMAAGNRDIVCFSLKTSFRERWRQCQHEANLIKRDYGRQTVRYYALRFAYDQKTWKGRDGKIEQMPDADGVFFADTSPGFDELIIELGKETFREPDWNDSNLHKRPRKQRRLV